MIRVHFVISLFLMSIATNFLQQSEAWAAPFVLEDFEGSGPCISELQGESSLGAITAPCMFYLDHGSVEVSVQVSTDQAQTGAQSLVVSNIPSNPPAGNYPWVSLGLSKNMIAQLGTQIDGGAKNVGFWVRTNGVPARVAVKISSSGWGDGYVLYEGRELSGTGWQFLSWPVFAAMGDMEVIRFDFFNDSTAKLTAYIDGIQTDLDVTTNSPDAPTGLSAAGDILKVALTWNPHNANNIVRYRLERSFDNGSSFSTRASVPPHHTSFEDYAMPLDGATVQYRLQAIDSSGNESASSSSVTASALAFEQSEELHTRMSHVVTALSSEGSDFQNYFPFGYEQQDIDQFATIDADYMYRGWFIWRCEASGEDFTSESVYDLFEGASIGPKTVQAGGGVFGGGVPLSAMCADDVPIDGYQSMMPFWQGEKKGGLNPYPVQCLKGTCPGPSLIVHHAGAQMAAGAGAVIIDSATDAQYGENDWLSITNMLRLKALELYEAGNREWPDVLVGRIWASEAVDYQTNVGNTFFLHGGCPGVKGDVDQLGNGAFLDAEGNRITGASCGSRSMPVAHLDNTITKFNFWHYVAYDDLNGMEKYSPGKPKFFALDIPSPIGDFIDLPLDDQINFFKTMVPEMQAAGYVFVFPIKQLGYSARQIGTLDTIKEQIAFYNAWRDLYVDRTVLWCDEVECENSYPDSYAVTAQIDGAPMATNLGSGGVSYILNDQLSPARRTAHLINHEYSGATIVPQMNFTLSYDVPFAPVTVYMVSPDSEDHSEQVDLEFTYDGSRVSVEVPWLYHYDVVVVEGESGDDSAGSSAAGCGCSSVGSSSGVGGLGALFLLGRLFWT